MSSSPFELFRRNLKPLMVALTLLALFSFVILPSVAMYQQQNSGYGPSETTLAAYQGGDFEINKVNFFTRNHNATVEFLNELAETTIRQGGAPKVAGFQYDTQNKSIRALGINSNPGNETSVRALMFAAEAKKIGLDLDDTAVRNWLTLFSDGRLSDGEINSLIATSTRNQLGQMQLYEQLRTHLLAQAFQQRVMSGLTVAGLPITPPAEQWDLFLRLNRRAVADAYAVNIADFIGKTNDKPSEKQIQDLYEEGKSRFPDPESPQASFRRPYTANFEYLAGNLDDFIDREKAKLSDEALRAEYDARVAAGEFNVAEPPAEDNPAEDTPADETPAEDTPSTETPAEDTPAPDAPTKEAPAATNSPAEAMPAEDSPATEMPADDKPTEDKPTEGKPTEDKPADETPAEDKPANEDSSRRVIDNGVRLVVAQEQPADEPAIDQTPAEPAEPDVDTEAETDAPKVDEPKIDEPKTADAPTTEEAKTETAPAKVQSFEEVKDELARIVAMQPALDKLDAAVTTVNQTMRTFFNARAIAGGKTDKIPNRPDLKALAEQLGMKHVVTAMQNVVDIQNDAISLSRGVGVGMQRGEPWGQTMYVARTPLFSPVRSIDDQAQISYVSWKTQDAAELIPELKDCRDEVISAIRTAEARKLAKAEADRLAKEFASSDKPVKELVPTERSSMVFESLGPFSWMTSIGFGMRAFMGNVPELDRVGDAFMRQVFTSNRGEWGVAPNMPETVYYVVRPTEFSPSTDELHQRFTQLPQRMQTMSLAIEETIKIRDGYYDALEDRVGFKWNEKAFSEQ